MPHVCAGEGLVFAVRQLFQKCSLFQQKTGVDQRRDAGKLLRLCFPTLSPALCNPINAIKSPIRCDFDFDSIKISTASNIGKFTDMINTDNFGQKITIGFNNKFMLEALSARCPYRTPSKRARFEEASAEEMI